MCNIWWFLWHVSYSKLWNSLLMRRFFAWINGIERLSGKFVPVRDPFSSFLSDSFKSLFCVRDSLLPVVKEEPPLQKLHFVCTWGDRNSGNGTDKINSPCPSLGCFCHCSRAPPCLSPGDALCLASSLKWNLGWEKRHRLKTNPRSHTAWSAHGLCGCSLCTALGLVWVSVVVLGFAFIRMKKQRAWG